MAGERYFAGANTARGYEHFLDELRPAGARVCVLRGALGTGRHAVIARLAAEWEAAGREVTRYADPEDAGRLAAAVSGDWAVVDGAAPHRVETRPGDMAIDLSAALRPGELADCRETADALHRRMRELRQRTYRCLRAADAAREDAAAILSEAVDAGAVYNLRLTLSRWLEGGPGGRRRVFDRAVTADGVTAAAEAPDRPCVAQLSLPWGYDMDGLLYPLAVGLHVRGIGCTASMQLLDGGKLEGLRTDTHAIVHQAAEETGEYALKFDSAVLRREQQTLRFDRAAYDLWLHQAVETLREAREARDSLERLIADTADRDKLAEMAARASGMFR